MITVDFDEVAKKIVKVCARVQKGETVYIRGRSDNLDFCEKLALHCRKIGAYPLTEVVSDDYRFRDLTESPVHVIQHVPRHFLSALEGTDVLFSVGVEPQDPRRFRDIPPEREGARRAFSKQIIDLFNRFPDKRRVGIGYPTREQAELYNLEFSSFFDMFWKAMNIDYEHLSERAKALARIVSEGREVHITTKKGTDLHMDIGERRVSIDDGIIDEEDMRTGNRLLNLPTGEVYTTPHEDTVEGKVVFDMAFHRGNRMEDVTVLFSEGIASPLSAGKGFSRFTQILENATGDRYRIGELGIGLNPQVMKAVGYVLTDEKFVGTIHLAFGENRSYGGRNESDIHWDVLVMAPTVTIDGRLLLEKGRLLI
ncbi:MAG: aminopeptidase [Theionarchaea archaeon]|nr:aminopeptidase [Theionarchaea archaeon]